MIKADFRTEAVRRVFEVIDRYNLLNETLGGGNIRLAWIDDEADEISVVITDENGKSDLVSDTIDGTLSSLQVLLCAASLTKQVLSMYKD